MPKLLCIIALVISILVFLLFTADLVLGFAGSPSIAPFKFSNYIVDIIFAVCSGILGALSWFTLREQV